MHENEHEMKYSTYIYVWLALVVLTWVTVAVASIDFGNAAVFVALLIAAFKSSLVVAWFMHLKNESATIKWMVATLFIVFAIFIGITFTDYPFR
ncbi:MAG: cytochrome-c oxidase [Calditrichaeota bacterium]|nr:MAG: cytochrome-c oxidase [Calditrichota bacterium]